MYKIVSLTIISSTKKVIVPADIASDYSQSPHLGLTVLLELPLCLHYLMGECLDQVLVALLVLLLLCLYPQVIIPPRLDLGIHVHHGFLLQLPAEKGHTVYDSN